MDLWYKNWWFFFRVALSILSHEMLFERIEKLNLLIGFYAYFKYEEYLEYGQGLNLFTWSLFCAISSTKVCVNEDTLYVDERFKHKT